jgi:hypothetical protein
MENSCSIVIVLFTFLNILKIKFVYILYCCRDLLQHMRLHGVTEPEDYISKAMQGKSTQKMVPVKEEVTYSTQDVEVALRYPEGQIASHVELCRMVLECY